MSIRSISEILLSTADEIDKAAMINGHFKKSIKDIVKKQVEIKTIKDLIKIKQERAALEPCNITKALIKTEIDAHTLKLADLIAEGDE